MSIYSSSRDVPGQLQAESRTVELKLERTGQSTGKISWNIPSSILNGCSDDKGVYDGILITLSTEPASITDLPKDTILYNADPTADFDLHSGDRIGDQYVIGSFYHDKTTTELNISGMNPEVPYYVQAYLVDSQFRYNVNSPIYAYEQNLGSGKKLDKPAIQEIKLTTDSKLGYVGVLGSDGTKLLPGMTYNFSFKINDNEYSIGLDGLDAGTYADLINELNLQFKQLNSPYSSPFAPNTNQYYWNSSEHKLYQWTGTQLIEQINLLYSATDPSNVLVGQYWFNPSNPSIINQWDGSIWQPNNYVAFDYNPSNPKCDDIWFTGTNAYQWDGSIWQPMVLHIQSNNPCTFEQDACGSYWYNTKLSTLFKYDTGIWGSVSAVYWNEDPNNLTQRTISSDGTFWFNLTDNKLYEYTNTGWVQDLAFVQTSEPAYVSTVLYWYNPDTEILKKYDIGLLQWTQVSAIIWSSDPTDRLINPLWWDSNTDQLYVWDTLNSSWHLVVDFYQGSDDPRQCPQIKVDELWFDSINNVLYSWDGVDWIVAKYIAFPTDPTIPNNMIWYNSATKKWYVYSTTWNEINPTINVIDPTNIPTGVFWYDPIGHLLFQRNGLSWIPVNYSTTSLIPSKGTLWFDTNSKELKMWNGNSWVISDPIVHAELSDKGHLLLITKDLGACVIFQILGDTANNNLFTALSAFIDIRQQKGFDAVSDKPSYMQKDVGTDYTSDERNRMIHELKIQLGFPTLEVELNLDQLNFCIDQALRIFRQNSSMAYKRGYFFLEVQPNTNEYILSDRCVGFNKIVNVMNLHRMTSAFLTSSGSGAFGQLMAQQMFLIGGNSSARFDLLTFDLVGQYINQLEISLANRLQFTWNETTRKLHIANWFSVPEKILVDATIERLEQDLMLDRFVRPWLSNYAKAMAMRILAQIRGKFASLPGAGSGITLNASDLQSQSDALIDKLMAEITDYIMDSPEDYGMGSTFVFG